MKNDITELRSILFDTLRGLKNKETPTDVSEAKAVADIAQTIINTAKVEVDHIRITGSSNQSSFLAAEDDTPRISDSYVHRIKG